MKPFLVLIFAIFAHSAAASTWKDEASSIKLNADLVLAFKAAEICELKPEDSSVHSIHNGAGTIFVLHNDGSIEAFKNMIAERLALDYCWK